MSAWKEYVALWRAAFDDSDLKLMFLVRFALLALHAILICAVALTVLVLADGTR